MDTGFSGVDLELLDYSEAECHEFSTIFSTAMPFSATCSNLPRPTIILGDDKIDDRKFSDSLIRGLATVGFSSCTKQTLSEAAKSSAPAELTIILTDFDRPFLSTLDYATWVQLQTTITKCSKVILWVSGNKNESGSPNARMLDGFSRAIRTELENLQQTILFLDPNADVQLQVEMVLRVFTKMASGMNEGRKMVEPEYEMRNDLLHIPRVVWDQALSTSVQHVESPATQKMSFNAGPPLKMELKMPATPDSIVFLEDIDIHGPVASTEVEIRIEFSGLNWRDYLTVFGQHDSQVFGGEFSGLVSKVGSDLTSQFAIGDRVVAACPLNTFRTSIRCRKEHIVKVPDNITLAEACAAPVAYTTAHYALTQLARLSSGESILIHLGSGGTGQAAIQFAQHIGATVYTTVSSVQKKKLLMEEYHIPESHIFSNKTTCFEERIKEMTGGRGVDVVFNMLSGEGLLSSWNCIASFGRFLEIGKKDVLDRAKLPMHNFHRNVSFAVVDLELLLLDRPELGHRSLQAVMDMFAEGSLTAPRPLTTFGIGELELAFRKFQSRTHVGKMVVQMRGNDLVKVCCCILKTLIFSR